MKILLIIVSVILLATAAGSGYFIYDLTVQIGDLESRLSSSYQGLDEKMSAKISETDAILGKELQTSSELASALKDTNSTLSSFIKTADSKINEVEKTVDANNAMISSLSTATETLETRLNAFNVDSGTLYEELKDSIVMISNGEFLFGSGFIIDPIDKPENHNTKWVVTAYHVVDEIVNIYVTLNNGQNWKAIIIGGSEELDIAILMFISNTPDGYLPDMPALKPVKLADSGKVKPGDPVFVIGSPGDGEASRLGLNESIVAGIVSYNGRCATIKDYHPGRDDSYLYPTNLIQFDASVNSGNSGSPLFNADGEVIGVVISSVIPSQGSGISLAVTSNMVINVESVIEAMIPQNLLITYTGKAYYEYKVPQTGLTLRDMLPKEVLANRNVILAGTKVTAVTSPAENAGIRAGDIITKIDQHEIRDTGGFYYILHEYYRVGDTVILEIVRDGEHLSIEFLLI